MRVAIIIPACNEEACIGETLHELNAILSAASIDYIIAVGLNGTTDRTAEIAHEHGALVGFSDERGYGHGCMAAIQVVLKSQQQIDCYAFCAADGASDPRDLLRMLNIYQKEDLKFLLGQRTFAWQNLKTIGLVRWLANVILGLASGGFSDLGPLRIIDAKLFHSLGVREFTMGWTAEMQMLVRRRNEKIGTCTVSERERSAGEQKISGVSISHSLKVGRLILEAIWRVRNQDYPK